MQVYRLSFLAALAVACGGKMDDAPANVATTDGGFSSHGGTTSITVSSTNRGGTTSIAVSSTNRGGTTSIAVSSTNRGGTTSIAASSSSRGGTTSIAASSSSRGGTTTSTGGTTRPISCADQTKNGSETDTDCGGTLCAPCAVGQACRVTVDCRSLNCANDVCRKPVCTSDPRCSSLLVPGGTFPMGRSLSGSDASSCTLCMNDEQPEHPATVSPFYLDQFEATVGRFRQFVEAFGAWRAAGHPTPNEGAHPLISGSGWQAQWDPNLPLSSAALIASVHQFAGRCTWTDNATTNETSPMNGLSWYVAFAFCLWDGGRLPTEAEWEFAAAGGDENRLYPWGSAPPTAQHANTAGGSASPLTPVGSTPRGNGRWGHADLAGSLWEWVLDDLEPYPTMCVDCANLVSGSSFLIRGGCFANSPTDGNLRAAKRFSYGDSNGYDSRGVRCAR